MDNFYKFITSELNHNANDVMHHMFDNSFTSNEIGDLINDCGLNKVDYNIPTHESYYKKFKREFRKDQPNISGVTIQHFSDSDFLLAGSTFDTDLRNLVEMYEIKCFIMQRKDNKEFIQNIPTLIVKISDVIKTKTSVIKIQDVVAIKEVSIRYATNHDNFQKLDDAIGNIIKGLLDKMVVNCSKIAKKGNSILLTRIQIANEGSSLRAMYYDNQFTNANIGTDSLASVKIGQIVTEFQLSSKPYILGRFIKYRQEDNKIPVFSSTYPHIECENHAQINVNDKEVTIQNLQNYPHNGTDILRDDVTIEVPSFLIEGPPIQLFNNDILCIGRKIPKFDIRSRQIQNDRKTINDAQYILLHTKPDNYHIEWFY